MLIDPSAFDAEGGNDLFPSHFIISLPPPPGGNYVGAAQLFGRDRLPGDADTSTQDGLAVIEFVPDYEVEHAGAATTAKGRVSSRPYPPSLNRCYVTMCWLPPHGRTLGRSEPCTTLIHTDMRRAMQNPLASEVTVELAYIRQRRSYETNEYRPQLAALE